MSASEEISGEVAEKADFIQIETSLSSSTIIDEVIVGDLLYPAWEVEFEAGQPWPGVFKDPSTGKSTFDIEVTQRYRITSSSAVRSKNADPAPQHWRIDEERTHRDTANRTLTLSLVRSRNYEGSARIRPGNEVYAWLAFSPASSSRVTWAENYTIYWENEFSGSGYGLIQVSDAAGAGSDSQTADSENSGAVASWSAHFATLLVAGSLTLLF